MTGTQLLVLAWLRPTMAVVAWVLMQLVPAIGRGRTRKAWRAPHVLASGVVLGVTSLGPQTVQGQYYPQFGLQVDQDVLFPPAADFTVGVQFDFPRSRLGQTVLGWVDWHAGRLAHQALAGNSTREATSAHFGFSAFTPMKANLGTTEPILDDRPYASMLYADPGRRRGRISMRSPQSSRWGSWAPGSGRMASSESQRQIVVPLISATMPAAITTARRTLRSPGRPQ